MTISLLVLLGIKQTSDHTLYSKSLGWHQYLLENINNFLKRTWQVSHESMDKNPEAFL